MNGRVTSTSARWASTGLPDFLGTALLFHHNGLPRTPFYTQKYLKGALEAAGVPASISANLANYRYKFSARIRSALEQSGAFLPLDEAHRRFGKELARTLDAVLPEYAPFNIYFSYYYDANSTENAVSSILENGCERLVLASITPFESPDRINLRREKILKLLSKENREIRDINTGNISFVGKKRPISFDFQEASVGGHESLVRYFAEKISLSADSSDAILFAAPLSHPLHYLPYSKLVHTTSKRIAYALYEKYPRALPFRVAFYPSWDYIYPFRSFSSINSQLKDLNKFGHKNPLIVPLGTLFPDFDTQTIIPTIVQGKTNVQLLRPQGPEKSLLHSMTELAKTQILTQKLMVDKSRTEPLF
ncbi:unnamed protein product [Bursaphelenchus xylophilus]|uniref:(pine wood nematode) hypothetical protein n=1 Tax=Bursaphelenchus xylophilus TaxID=6326 RepID=A0A1I7RLG4_BURXY|nr:unnamed protein product [Bursaphelenchus xylophilus]CAG9083010.1 unnamed protein product [Bursaphelenchus xylophilus]